MRGKKQYLTQNTALFFLSDCSGLDIGICSTALALVLNL